MKTLSWNTIVALVLLVLIVPVLAHASNHDRKLPTVSILAKTGEVVPIICLTSNDGPIMLAFSPLPVGTALTVTVWDKDGNMVYTTTSNIVNLTIPINISNGLVVVTADNYLEKRPINAHE